jgi:hypothetical protein
MLHLGDPALPSPGMVSNFEQGYVGPVGVAAPMARHRTSAGWSLPEFCLRTGRSWSMNPSAFCHWVL